MSCAQALAARLPDYMVPAAFVVLDGSAADRQRQARPAALPAARLRRAGRAGPRDERREGALCELFAEVLGLPSVGVDDNFFDLGGDSIVSIQLVARARAAGLVFTPREVFERKTVAALAVVAGDADTQAVPVAGERHRQDAADTGHVPAAGAGRECGPFQPGRAGAGSARPGRSAHLVTATAAVLDHHDMLRSRLHTIPGDEQRRGWCSLKSCPAARSMPGPASAVST